MSPKSITTSEPGDAESEYHIVHRDHGNRTGTEGSEGYEKISASGELVTDGEREARLDDLMNSEMSVFLQTLGKAGQWFTDDLWLDAAQRKQKDPTWSSPDKERRYDMLVAVMNANRSDFSATEKGKFRQEFEAMAAKATKTSKSSVEAQRPASTTKH